MPGGMNIDERSGTGGSRAFGNDQSNFGSGTATRGFGNDQSGFGNENANTGFSSNGFGVDSDFGGKLEKLMYF